MQQCVSGIYYINIFHIELGHNLVVTIRFLTGMRIQESSRIIASSLTRGMFQFGTLFLSTSPLNTWLELQKLSILFFVCWECSIDPKNAVVPSVNQTWLAGKPPIYFDDVPIKPFLALHLRVFFPYFLSVSLSLSLHRHLRKVSQGFIYIYTVYIYIDIVCSYISYVFHCITCVGMWESMEIHGTIFTAIETALPPWSRPSGIPEAAPGGKWGPNKNPEAMIRTHASILY